MFFFDYFYIYSFILDRIEDCSSSHVSHTLLSYMLLIPFSCSLERGHEESVVGNALDGKIANVIRGVQII